MPVFQIVCMQKCVRIILQFMIGLCLSVDVNWEYTVSVRSSSAELLGWRGIEGRECGSGGGRGTTFFALPVTRLLSP